MQKWASAAIIMASLTGLAGCGTRTGTTTAGQEPSKHVSGRASKNIENPHASSAPHGRFNPQALDMVSPSVGWAWSQDAVWWTADGGLHWRIETPTPLSHDATLTVHVVSQDVAWVAVATSLTQKPPLPVWITATHGTHWKRTSSPPHNDGISYVESRQQNADSQR